MSITDIRNKIIDQLMSVKDKEFLRALSDMIDRAHVQENVIQLTEEQKIMLAMSEEDIQTGRTIDQFTLNEREWNGSKENNLDRNSCPTAKVHSRILVATKSVQ
jgi:hypothetical protein